MSTGEVTSDTPPPVGTYIGTWCGYQIVATAGETVVRLRTQHGVRGLVPVAVKIVEGQPIVITPTP